MLTHARHLVIVLDLHIPFSHMPPARGLRYLYKINLRLLTGGPSFDVCSVVFVIFSSRRVLFAPNQTDTSFAFVALCLLIFLQNV